MANNILAKMTVQIAAQNAQFISAMDQSNKKLAGFEKSILTASKTLGAAFIASKVYSGIEYGIGVMKDFEKQMDTVAAVSGATGDDLKKLQDNAINLAGAFRSIDIAKMETELARLGFSTGEIINSTKAIVDLATATGEDLAKSAEIVGSTLRAFQIDAKDSGRVAEVMAIGFNTSALALDNFGEAMKYVAPVANAANLSLEQTTALLGVLADNGIKGSMAGTSLRKIISDLGQGAAPVLNQRLKEMAAAGLSGAAAMDEVGRTAYASLLILANNTDKVEEAIKAQQTMKGTLENTSKIMQDNLQGDIDKLNASWDRMFISTSGLVPVFRSLVNAAKTFVDSLSGVTKEQEFENAFNAAQDKLNSFLPGLKVTAAQFQVLQERGKALGIELGATFDETGKKILSVYKIVRDQGLVGPANQTPFHFLAEGAKELTTPTIVRSVGFLKQQIEELNTKIESSGSKSQIEDYQRKISRLKTEIDKLLGTVNSPDFEKVFGQSEEEFRNKAFDLSGNFNPSLPEGYQNQSFDMSGMDDDLKKSQEIFDEWVRSRQEGFAKAAHSAATFGDIIGDTLAASIEGGEKFGQALARQVDRAVTELYRLAVGYVLAKAAKDSLYNPIGAILGLTAGLIAFKAIYAGATKGQKANTTPSSTRSELRLSVDSEGFGKYVKAQMIDRDRYDALTRA